MNKFNLNDFLHQSSLILKGREEKITLALLGALSSSHSLIEDYPGVGKTTLVKLISNAFSLNLSRIQFTNDLLPSDIVGTHLYDHETKNFKFVKGPIFGEMVLADELNRGSSKTQSALLEAMEEKQITVDGNVFKLPSPFLVFATQNPFGDFGTYELPKSELDRFSLKFDIGYPERASTLEMLSAEASSNEMKKFFSKEEFLELSSLSQKTFIHEKALVYITSLLEESRKRAEYYPLSNRAGLDLVRLSKTYAFIQGREYVTTEDIYYLFPYVCGHRLNREAYGGIIKEHELSKQLLSFVKLR